MDNSLKRLGTVRTYNSLYKSWIEPIEFMVRKEEDLHCSIEWWQREGLSPRTIKILIRLLCDEVKIKYKIDLPKKKYTAQIMRNAQESDIKALTKEQSKLLLEAIKNTELHLPVLLALHTGMRRGEIFGLRWGNVDIFKGEIKVTSSYNGPTKNGKSRIVPISSLLEQKLLEIFPMKSDNSSKELVIPKQFDPNPGLRGACRRAGIMLISFHALRHTFATLALEAGRSPRKVQQVLGHTALSTTLNCYWSIMQEKLDTGFLE